MGVSVCCWLFTFGERVIIIRYEIVDCPLAESWQQHSGYTGSLSGLYRGDDRSVLALQMRGKLVPEDRRNCGLAEKREAKPQRAQRQAAGVVAGDRHNDWQ